MTKKDKGIDLEETFKQGVGGGILGAFVGAPGLGMALGVLHANKDKVKTFASDADKNMMPRFRQDGPRPHQANPRMLHHRPRYERSDCPYKKEEPVKKQRPMDDPAAYF